MSVSRHDVECVLPAAVRGEVIECALLAFRKVTAVLSAGKQGDRGIGARRASAEAIGELREALRGHEVAGVDASRHLVEEAKRHRTELVLEPFVRGVIEQG